MKDLRWCLQPVLICQARENGRIHANLSLSIDLGFRHWWTGKIKLSLAPITTYNLYTAMKITSVNACNCPSCTTAPSYLSKKGKYYVMEGRESRCINQSYLRILQWFKFFNSWTSFNMALRLARCLLRFKTLMERIQISFPGRKTLEWITELSAI